jgi:hypothetical protein
MTPEADLPPAERIRRAEYWTSDGRIAWSRVIQYHGADGWLYNTPDQAPSPYYEVIYDREAADLLRAQGQLYSQAHTGRRPDQIIDNVQGS